MKQILVILICLTFTTSLFAEGIDRASITYKGTKGIFFSEDIATDLLIDIEEYKAQEHHLHLLETSLKLRDEKIKLLELDVEYADEIAKKYKDAYILENKLRTKDREHYEGLLKKKNSFWTSPGFWFGVGFVVASAAAVGLSFSLQEARD